MRPTKLTSELLDAFRAVLADEWAALAFTEEELVWQANQRLPAEDRISYRTYQRYKADILYLEEVGDDGEGRVADADDTANAALVQGMHETLKAALMAQKKALVRGVGEGQPNWRRYSWLLERKFPDFRLPRPVGSGQREKTGAEGKTTTETDKETTEQDNKRREAYLAKVAAEKAEHEERMRSNPAYKWQWKGQPWEPSPGGYYTMPVNELRQREEEMARDVAAGYENPYAHLEYRPDPVERKGGHYLIMGMGPDRLPLRVHVYRTADAPLYHEREALWQAQDLERRNIIRAEQGLPPEDPPEKAAPVGPGTIYGFS